MTNVKVTDFEVFIKLMMMTTSDNDHEVLISSRKANAILARMNKTWEDFCRDRVAQSDFPDAPPIGGPLNTGGGVKHTDPFITTMFAEILASLSSGNSFRDYVEDVNRFWNDKGFLTERQYQVIKKSWDNTQRRRR